MGHTAGEPYIQPKVEGLATHHVGFCSSQRTCCCLQARQPSRLLEWYRRIRLLPSSPLDGMPSESGVSMFSLLAGHET